MSRWRVTYFTAAGQERHVEVSAPGHTMALSIVIDAAYRDPAGVSRTAAVMVRPVMMALPAVVVAGRKAARYRLPDGVLSAYQAALDENNKS